MAGIYGCGCKEVYRFPHSVILEINVVFYSCKLFESFL